MKAINLRRKQKLILIGGGHSHAILLELWAKNPLSDVELILISDTKQTPYSGMLPGLIAGYYSFAETHIDLVSLCNRANAKLYLNSAIGLNLETKEVICQNNQYVNFDILSIDIGSTPTTEKIKGAIEYATPAKPVPKLLTTWFKLLEKIEKDIEGNLNINIIGGGAGGVELALNMHAFLHNKINKNKLTISIFQKNKTLLPNYNNWVQNKLTSIFKAKNITLYLGVNVTEIKADKIVSESGLEIPSTHTFLVTQASAPDWIKNSGLATDNRGFILVNNTLQSVSHYHVFATGDIATIENYPRPKAGVFPVRQGKPLWQNLQRILTNKTLITYIPQKQYLSLIGTGYNKNDQRMAIASWGNFACQSPLLWYWKDYIDRKFMSRFNH